MPPKETDRRYSVNIEEEWKAVISIYHPVTTLDREKNEHLEDILQNRKNM